MGKRAPDRLPHAQSWGAPPAKRRAPDAVRDARDLSILAAVARGAAQAGVARAHDVSLAWVTLLLRDVRADAYRPLGRNRDVRDVP